MTWEDTTKMVQGNLSLKMNVWSPHVILLLMNVGQAYKEALPRLRISTERGTLGTGTLYGYWVPAMLYFVWGD